jgi:hypothetical protein
MGIAKQGMVRRRFSVTINAIVPPNAEVQRLISGMTLIFDSSAADTVKAVLAIAPVTTSSPARAA